MLTTVRPDCVFEPRCGFARDECRSRHPDLDVAAHGHAVRCLRWREIDTAEPMSDGLSAIPARREQARPLLGIHDLKSYYEPRGGLLARWLGRRRPVRAVDGVSLAVAPGETLSVVGESGCGKSTLARCIAGLVRPTGGRLTFRELDISTVVEDRDPAVRRDIQMVFQNPDSTLNPAHRVRRAIARPLRRLRGTPRAEVDQEVRRLLGEVQLDESFAERLPQKLSGGQKQRVAIARALAGQSALVICDEPVSALDVSVQASILNLLLDLQRVRGTAMIFISHDLSVVRLLSDAWP